MWSNLSKLMVVVSLTIFILALQSCASTAVQPAASDASSAFDSSTQVSLTESTPSVETPACTEETVFPIITDVQPSPAQPGSEITITGTGRYVQDSCGGINESARSFQLYLDDEPVGDLSCYVNHCESKISLASSIESKSHCLSTQPGVCEFQFQVDSVTATPTTTFTSDNWQEYSSKFTSHVGTIQYNLRFPQGWYVYPGSTQSEPGLEGQTYIQDFMRIGNIGGDTSDYQVAGTVRLEIYAVPCAGNLESCDPPGLSILAPNSSGVKQIETLGGWTIWIVFLYKKDYRLSLQGYMIGTPEQNADLIKVLDKILSTVVIE